MPEVVARGKGQSLSTTICFPLEPGRTACRCDHGTTASNEGTMPTERNRPRSRHRLRGLARILLAALLLADCGCRSALHPGVVVEHRPGEAPRARPVPYAAAYTLFAVDPLTGAALPLERADVQDRYQVGFIREPDGSLVAYASGQKFPLPEGCYAWRIAPESQKTYRELRQAKLGPALAAAGKGATYAALGVLCLAGLALYGIAAAGGHN
jgi:hypothetical protein